MKMNQIGIFVCKPYRKAVVVLWSFSFLLKNLYVITVIKKSTHLYNLIASHVVSIVKMVIKMVVKSFGTIEKVNSFK